MAFLPAVGHSSSMRGTQGVPVDREKGWRIQQSFNGLPPELLPILELRYKILRQLLFNQPLGRRALSGKIAVGERIIRRSWRD